MNLLISPGQTRPPCIRHSPWRPPNTPTIPNRSTSKLKPRAKGFGKSDPTLSTTNNRALNAFETKLRTNRGDDDDTIAPEVWERMLRRILVFVGTPMASGVALLVILSTLKDHQVWDVPLWLPFLTTLLCFGSSAIGIAYGSLSTSLDPEKKGTVLGWEEVQRNWPEMWRAEDESR